MRALIPVVLLALAGWFAMRPAPEWPIPGRADLGALSVDSSPLRALDPDPGVIDVGGAPLRCNDCHALFESDERQRTPIGQHQDVVVDHGRNDNCLTCHDREDRSLLRDSTGARLAFTETVRLCAGCHGPTWRDWEGGIHGRTNGYWDQSRGEQQRLVCIECHDPHRPAIRGLSPFPGPNTLRMGDAAKREEHESGPRNPLHTWRGQAARQQEKGPMMVPAESWTRPDTNEPAGGAGPSSDGDPAHAEQGAHDDG